MYEEFWKSINNKSHVNGEDMGRYGVIRQDTCTNVLPINMRAVAYNKEKRIAHSQSKIIAFLACSFNNPLLARVNGSKSVRMRGIGEENMNWSVTEEVDKTV